MNTGLKIYTDFSSFEQNNLKNLNPILSFHWDNLELGEILDGKSNPASSIMAVTNPDEADWFVLPMYWSYYLWNDKAKLNEALRLAELARKYNRKVIVWYKGDLIPIVPFENSILFLPGMLKSNQNPNQRACPVFVNDPASIFNNGEPRYRQKKDKPSVGFCGYASISAIKFVWSVFKGIQLNAASRMGKYEYEGVPIIPATLTRARALNLLSKHSKVETCFVIRDKYYGNKFQEKSSTTAEAAQTFYSNIFEADYTLCLRGYGNWSYRFYETLACGRIPVFIDTDCVLPLSSKIDWQKYCVWVDRSELKYIAEKISDFHSSLSPAEFIDTQIACRKLWEDHLTLNGFMNHFEEYL